VIVHPHKIESGQKRSEGAGSMFNLFAKNDGFWWPYRSLASALLLIQKNAATYFDVNRKLVDDMRDIIRREQDLALEISQSTLASVARADQPDGITMPGASQMSAVFERAASGLREMGEAWMGAQMRSLDAMKSHACGTKESTAKVQRESSVGA